MRFPLENACFLQGVPSGHFNQCIAFQFPCIYNCRTRGGPPGLTGGSLDSAGCGVWWYARATCFAPRLPDAIRRRAFHLLLRGRRLRVEVRATEATYRLLDDLPLVVRHHAEEIRPLVDDAVTQSIPAIQAGPPPTQPPGRAPLRRGPCRSS